MIEASVVHHCMEPVLELLLLILLSSLVALTMVVSVMLGVYNIQCVHHAFPSARSPVLTSPARLDRHCVPDPISFCGRVNVLCALICVYTCTIL